MTVVDFGSFNIVSSEIPERTAELAMLSYATLPKQELHEESDGRLVLAGPMQCNAGALVTRWSGAVLNSKQLGTPKRSNSVSESDDTDPGDPPQIKPDRPLLNAAPEAIRLGRA